MVEIKPLFREEIHTWHSQKLELSGADYFYNVCIRAKKCVHPCREEHLLRGRAVKARVGLCTVCVKSSAVFIIFLQTSHVFENKGPLFGVSDSCVVAIIWFLSMDISVFFPLIFAEPLWSHKSFLLSRRQVYNERTVWLFFLYFLNSSDDQLLFLAAIKSIILNIYF